MNASNRCTSAGCVWNETTATNSGFTGDCANNASGERLGCTSVNEIPLYGLFAGSGVVFYVIMGVLAIVVIGAFIKRKK